MVDSIHLFEQFFDLYHFLDIEQLDIFKNVLIITVHQKVQVFIMRHLFQEVSRIFLVEYFFLVIKILHETFLDDLDIFLIGV